METVFRGACIYLALLIVTRISGRRSLAQSTPFDMVLLLVFAEATQQALIGDDYSITTAVVLIVTLAGLDILLAWAKARWRWAEDLLDGRPTVLVEDGEPVWEAIAKARVTLADVMQAGRMAHGLRCFDEIEAAVLEVDGTISIVPRTCR